jgi:hypothetical protein
MVCGDGRIGTMSFSLGRKPKNKVAAQKSSERRNYQKEPGTEMRRKFGEPLDARFTSRAFALSGSDSILIFLLDRLADGSLECHLSYELAGEREGYSPDACHDTDKNRSAENASLRSESSLTELQELGQPAKRVGEGFFTITRVIHHKEPLFAVISEQAGRTAFQRLTYEIFQRACPTPGKKASGRCYPAAF